MQGYSDIGEMLNGCNSVGHVGTPSYGGKSGKVLVYDVEIDTNPIEFLVEISQKEGFENIGVLFDDTASSIHVLDAVDDLFSYLMQEGSFDGFNFPLSESVRIVKDVVDRIKDDSISINYNFYFNELTPDWFWRFAKENGIV